MSKLLAISTSTAVTGTSVYSPLPESILTPSGDHRRGLIIVSSKISFAEIRLTARAQMRKRREFCLTEGLRRKLLLKSLFYNRYPSNSLFCLDELCCYCDFSDTIYCVEYFSMQTAGKLTCVSHSYIRWIRSNIDKPSTHAIFSTLRSDGLFRSRSKSLIYVLCRAALKASSSWLNPCSMRIFCNTCPKLFVIITILR